jgi:hypothetical protein
VTYSQKITVKNNSENTIAHIVHDVPGTTRKLLFMMYMEITSKK